MAVSVRASGAWTGDASTETTVTIPGAGSYQAGDLGICVSVWKSYDNAGSIDNGWTEIFDGTGGSTAAGNGSGSVRLFVAYKVFTSGSETNPTVVGDNGCHQDVIIVLQKGATETWDITALSAAVEQNMGTTAMSHSLTTTAAVQDGDWIFALTGVQDDSATFTRATTAISGGGITYDGNVVEYPATHGSTTSGQDGAADLIYRKVTTGVASGASVTVTATLSAAERVGSVLFRVGVDAGATTGSFTANAVIAKTISGSFGANAVIKREMTGSTTANAQIVVNVVGATTANATIKATINPTATANAVVKKTMASSTTANAVLLKAAAGSFTANALLLKTTAGSLTANAVVFKSMSGSTTANAITLRTQAGSLLSDAVVYATRTGSFFLDAVIPGVGGNDITWTTPGDGVEMPANPTLAFLMPSPAMSDMHFQIQIDTDSGFPAPIDYRSWSDQSGWEYFDGADWQPIPQSGVPAAYGGNEARYTVASTLPNGFYYRRVRAGYI